jgi:hypothetical protein
MAEPARKRRILSEAEAAVRRLLLAQRPPDPARLRARAEEAREARLRFLEGQRVLAERELGLTTSPARADQLRAHLDGVAKRAAEWRAFTTDEVLDHYRARPVVGRRTSSK